MAVPQPTSSYVIYEYLYVGDLVVYIIRHTVYAYNSRLNASTPAPSAVSAVLAEKIAEKHK